MRRTTAFLATALLLAGLGAGPALADGDGDVDGRDFGVQNGESADVDLALGAFGAGPGDDGGTADGRVDAADYQVWRSNFGAAAAQDAPAADGPMPQTREQILLAR